MLQILTRSPSFERAHEGLIEKNIKKERQIFFNDWILDRSHYNHTALQKEFLKTFHRSLQAILTELWVGIKAVASGHLQIDRPQGLIEQLVYFSLGEVPYIGSVLQDAEQSIMMEPYKSRFQRCSERLSTFAFMDRLTEELSSRFTAYHQAEILNPSDEATDFEKTFAPILGFFGNVKQKIDTMVFDRQGFAVTAKHRAFMVEFVASILVALTDLEVSEEDDEWNLGERLTKHMGIVDFATPVLQQPQEVHLAQPIAQQMTQPTILRSYFSLLNISQLTYRNKSKIDERMARFSSFSWGDSAYALNSDMRGFLFTYKDSQEKHHIILGFRGTKTLGNLCTDLNTALEPWRPESSSQGGAPQGAKVHKGFYKAFQAVWPTLGQKFKALLQQSRPNHLPTVWCTGHSLGGAVAALAAAELVYTNPGLEIVLVTFGQPRVMNQALAEAFYPKLKVYTRFVSHGDPVPRVPPEKVGIATGYVHVGEEILLADTDSSGQILPQTKGIHPNHHKLPYYGKRFYEYAQRQAQLVLPRDQNLIEFEPLWKSKEVEVRAQLSRQIQRDIHKSQRENLALDESSSLESSRSSLDVPLYDFEEGNPDSIPLVNLLGLSQQLQNQLLAGQGHLLSAGLENFSKALDQVGPSQQQSYFGAAQHFENMATNPAFLDVSPDTTALLFACWNRCLFMGFVQTSGRTKALAPHMLLQLQKSLPPSKDPITATTYEEFGMLCHTADLFNYQQSHPNDDQLVVLAKELHALMSASVVERDTSAKWSAALNNLAASCLKHPFLAEEQRGLILLLRALRINPQIRTLAPVVFWVQERLSPVLLSTTTESVPPQNGLWLLSLTALRFLLTSLKTAPVDLAAYILLGSKTDLGLRHWRQNLIVLEKGSAEKAWCTQVFSTPEQLNLNVAHRQEPLFKSLKDVQWDFTKAFEALRKNPDPHLAYQGQQLHIQWTLLQGVPLGWEDYQALGRVSQNVNPQLAIKSYEKSKALLNPSIFSGTPSEISPETQTSLGKISTALSRLYLDEGKKLQSQNKIWAFKAYLKSLEQHAKSPALKELAETSLKLKGDQWLIGMRLATFARPLTGGETRDSALKAGHTVLQGIFSGLWVIEKGSSIQRELFEGENLRLANLKTDEKGKLTQEGRHRVACVGLAPHQLHIKENPSCPGLAFAAWSLTHLVFSLGSSTLATGLVPVEPFKMEHPTSKGLKVFYTQFSPTVLGPSFKEVLNAGTPLTTLEPVSLGVLTLASFLLDPEDARDANFIVEMEGNTPKRLVSVDNDHVWVREDVFEEKGLPGVSNERPRIKNILYCMPHMKEKIPDTLKEIFLRSPLSFLELLKIWLFSLSFYNQSLANVFPKNECQALFERKNDEDKVVLEAYFHPEQLGRLFLKGMQLKAALEKPGQTFFGAFLALQPKLASLYYQTFQERPQAPPKERFDRLTTGLFTSSGGTKTTNTQLVQMVMNKTIKNYQEFDQEKTSPESLIPFLQTFLGDLNQDGHIVEFVLQNLRSGYLTLFKEQPGIQENVLRRIPWKSFSPNVLTPAFHEEFLNSISNSLEEITFKQHPLLTDDDLIKLIERLNNPKALVVEDCPRVQGVMVAQKTLGGLFNRKPGNQKSLVQFCHAKNISKLIFSGENFNNDILQELVRCYGTVPSWGGDDLVQPLAWKNPQWGIPLKLKLYLYDISTTLVTGHTGSVSALTVLPTGEIVTGSKDDTIKIWALEGAEWVCTHTLTGHTGSVSALAVLPTGEIVSGSADGGTIKIWALEGAEWVCANTLTKEHRSSRWAGVRILTVLPTGYIAYTGGPVGITIWRKLSNGTWYDDAYIVAEHTWNHIVTAFAVLATGHIILSYQGDLWIWVSRGLYNWGGHSDYHVFHYHKDNIALMGLPTGQFVSSFEDGTMKIFTFVGSDYWDTTKWVCTQTFQEDNWVSAFALLPTGQFVTRSYTGETMKIFTFVGSEWVCTQTLAISSRSSRPEHCFAVLPTGQLIANSGSVVEIFSPKGYAPLEKPLTSHAERLKHNFDMLLRSGALQPHHIPLLLPPDLQTLDLGGVVLRADIKESLLKHCPGVKIIEGMPSS